jgi:hypothetical protein
MFYSKKPATQKASSKSKKKPAKNSFWQRNSQKLMFAASFAVTGGIVFIVATHAATTNTAGAILSGVGSTMCLDDHANIRANDNKIQLYTCNGSAAQNWTANSNGTISLTGSNYCLDVKGAGMVKTTIVQLYQCSATDVAEQWVVNNANHTIMNPHSGLYLDDKYSSADNGNQIWIWPSNDTNAQKWTVPQITTTTPPATTPPTTTPPATTTPPTTSPNPSGQAMPTGSLTGWKQIFADDFTGTVPVGAFSDCNHNTDTPQAYCGGLKNYGSYYANWWAYPSGWDDTSEECIKKENGCPDTSLKIPIGGVYSPEKAVSVSNGAMHINMYRPASGSNVVASVVPRKCMNQEYGRYVERFKVVHADPGFKSAHLFYEDNYEMDYPENDYGDTISAYTHPGEQNFNTNVTWTAGWHTTAIEWTSSSIKYYMDGKLVGTATKSIPHIKMTWVLQNESSILGPYAKAGASSQLDEDWVACYSQS